MSSRSNQRQKGGKQSGKRSQVKSKVGKTGVKTASKLSHKMSAGKLGPVKIASATKTKSNGNRTKVKNSSSSSRIHRGVSGQQAKKNNAATRRPQYALRSSNQRGKQGSSSLTSVAGKSQTNVKRSQSSTTRSSGQTASKTKVSENRTKSFTTRTSGQIAGKSQANVKRSQSSTTRLSGQAAKHSIGKVEKSETKLQLLDKRQEKSLFEREPAAKDQSATDNEPCSSILDAISQSEALLMRQFDEQLKLESKLNTEFNSQMVGAIRNTYDATFEAMSRQLEQGKQTGCSATSEGTGTEAGKQSTP